VGPRQARRQFGVLDRAVRQPGHGGQAAGHVRRQLPHPGQRGVEGAVCPAVFGGPFAGVDFAGIDGGDAAGGGHAARAPVAVALRAGADDGDGKPLVPVGCVLLREIFGREQLGVRQQRAAPEPGLVAEGACHGGLRLGCAGWRRVAAAIPILRAPAPGFGD